MSPKLIRILKVGVLLLMFIFVAGTVWADWERPLQPPPACPSGDPGCDPPVNVSRIDQTKLGVLSAGGLKAIVGLTVGNPGLSDGRLFLNLSGFGAGQVLTSDANGEATWQAPPDGGGGGGGGGAVNRVDGSAPIVVSPNTGNVRVSLSSCANNQILKFISGAWQCGADETSNGGGGNLDGSGSTNYIPLWQDSNTLTLSAIRQSSTGNIGIGKWPDTGGYQLQLSGGLNADGTISGDSVIADGLSGVLQWNGDLRPDGNSCSVGETIKKTGATSWACTPMGGADNLGNHAMTQNLRTGSNWISYSGESDNGLHFDSGGQAYFTDEINAPNVFDSIAYYTKTNGDSSQTYNIGSHAACFIMGVTENEDSIGGTEIMCDLDSDITNDGGTYSLRQRSWTLDVRGGTCNALCLNL